MNSVQSNPAGVNLFLNHANAMAEDIISPEKKFHNANDYSPYYQTPQTYHYYNANPYFPPERHVHHYHSTDNGSSKKSNALLLGTALTVAAGGMLYLVGAEYSKRSNAIDDLKRFEKDKRFAHLDLQQSNKLSPVATYHLETITDIQRDILQTYKNDSETRLAIKGSVTTGCAMGVYICAKAFFNSEYIAKASPMLGLASTALIVGGGFGWMLKSGLDSTSNAVHRKAQDLLEAIHSFNHSGQKTKV